MKNHSHHKKGWASKNSLYILFCLTLGLFQLLVPREVWARPSLDTVITTGQTLYARLRLDQALDDATDRVEIASSVEYQKLGLTKPIFLERVTVARNRTDPRSVYLTGREPINQERFDLLLTAQKNGVRQNIHFAVSGEGGTTTVRYIDSLPNMTERVIDNAASTPPKEREDTQKTEEPPLRKLAAPAPVPAPAPAAAVAQTRKISVANANRAAAASQYQPVRTADPAHVSKEEGALANNLQRQIDEMRLERNALVEEAKKLAQPAPSGIVQEFAPRTQTSIGFDSPMFVASDWGYHKTLNSMLYIMLAGAGFGMVYLLVSRRLDKHHMQMVQQGGGLKVPGQGHQPSTHMFGMGMPQGMQPTPIPLISDQYEWVPKNSRPHESREQDNLLQETVRSTKEVVDLLRQMRFDSQTNTSTSQTVDAKDQVSHTTANSPDIPQAAYRQGMTSTNVAAAPAPAPEPQVSTPLQKAPMPSGLRRPMQRPTPVPQQGNGPATQRANQPETSAMDIGSSVKEPVAATITTLPTPLTEDVSEKLQLATVYLNMGDLGMARTLIHELLTQGNEFERRQAQVLQQELFDRS